MEKYTIQNRKGQKLAVVADVSQPSNGLAFVVHGLGGFKEQVHIANFASAFREKNFTVVRFDMTNSIGASDGRFEDGTTTSYYEDLEDVIEWSRTQTWYSQPFVLAAHSLGSLCIALYAERYPERILGLAPIAPVVSGALSVQAHEKFDPKGFKEWKESGWQIKESVSRSGFIKRLPWSHLEDRLKYDALKNVNTLAMPVLIIVGDRDEQILYQAEKWYEHIPGRKEFHTVKSADHDLSKEEDLQETKEILQRWIDTLEQPLYAYVVAGVVIEKDGKYLLVQEKQPKAYGLWNLPAGKVDVGESLEEAAIREAREEVGYDVEIDTQLGLFHRTPREAIKHAFSSRIIGGDLHFSKEELLDARWFSFDEIMSMKESLRDPWVLGAIISLRASYQQR